MVINLDQIINAILSHTSAFLMVVGIIVIFFACFEISITPPDVKVPEKINRVRITIIVVGAILLILGIPLQLTSFPTPSGSAATSTKPPVLSPSTNPTGITTLPTQTTTTPGISRNDDSYSSLIPPGQQPVINDSLKDNGGGYLWDTETTSSGSCNFDHGQYLLTAPTTKGVGCNTESSESIFGNFVYQIRMTILKGINNDGSGAGATFRVNTTGNGQQYQALFDDKGDWQVSRDSKDLTGDICANPCSYFHSGLNRPNFITIRAVSDHIEIQINGHPLGSYVDNTYASGYIGVQIDPGTENSSVAFGNVRVWQQQ